MSFKDRSLTFCKRLGIHVPVLLAPMAGASAPSLSIAVINGGGLGGCGALLMQPEEILKWSATVRESSSDAFQLNLWVPDPAPGSGRSPDWPARCRTPGVPLSRGSPPG